MGIGERRQETATAIVAKHVEIRQGGSGHHQVGAAVAGDVTHRQALQFHAAMTAAGLAPGGDTQDVPDAALAVTVVNNRCIRIFVPAVAGDVHLAVTVQVAGGDEPATGGRPLIEGDRRNPCRAQAHDVHAAVRADHDLLGAIVVEIHHRHAVDVVVIGRDGDDGRRRQGAVHVLEIEPEAMHSTRYLVGDGHVRPPITIGIPRCHVFKPARLNGDTRRHAERGIRDLRHTSSRDNQQKGQQPTKLHCILAFRIK